MAQRATLPPVVVGQWVPMTFEEFLDWSPSEGMAEWVDGKGIVYVGNIPRHGQLQEFLTRLIGNFLEAHELGVLFPASTILRLPSRPSGREPDLMVILNEHRDRVGDRWVAGPADLVIELMSDDSVGRDREEKLREYEAEGVREYLLVDARLGKHGFDFYRLDEAGRFQPVPPDATGRYHFSVIPGFWIDPAWLRQDPLPKVAVVLAQIEAGAGSTAANHSYGTSA
jgi:Uma2 family endonuclease